MHKILLISIFTIFSLSSFAADKYVCHVNKKNICNGGICEYKKVLEDDYRIIDTINKTYTIRKNVYKLENISSSGFFTIFKVGSDEYIKMHWMKKDFLMNLERGEFMEEIDDEISTEISIGIEKLKEQS